MIIRLPKLQLKWPTKNVERMQRTLFLILWRLYLIASTPVDKYSHIHLNWRKKAKFCSSFFKMYRHDLYEKSIQKADYLFSFHNYSHELFRSEL
jgi:hypothetical protein